VREAAGRALSGVQQPPLKLDRRIRGVALAIGGDEEEDRVVLVQEVILRRDTDTGCERGSI
jgi:hypothetical protein